MFEAPTVSTFRTLLGRVAEKQLEAEARRKSDAIERWQKVESWLRYRMHRHLDCVVNFCRHLDKSGRAT